MEPARSVDWKRLIDKVIDPRLVERLEYEIQVIDDSGIPELKRARKLLVGIHEDGNTLEFKKKEGFRSFFICDSSQRYFSGKSCHYTN
jgi:hypothetical protein